MILLIARPGLAPAADDPDGVSFFEARIRPVLVERCYSCHSAQAVKLKGGLRLDTRELTRQGGDSGPAVVPEKPDESLLLQAIAYTDDLSRMPPSGKLPENVIADFRRWVQIGAPDPREASAKSPGPASGGTSEPGRSWWSLRRVAEGTLPRVDPRGAAWARTPIDAFILARLDEEGLRPAPEADRRTLIRRLSFDLLGLPPTPEEVSRYLADEAPDADERLVDRLLASPHYGERWARRWMDLVHFAETHGHDQDRIRPGAWPYRDYLIESFNGDKPYARFVEEQVAADALFPEQPGLVIALGMLAAGPWDESSLRDIREDSIDRQIGHYLDRDDMVSTVMSTFTSLTVHCARCHDHKFDPISQDDYYGLQAVFAGVGRGERLYDPDPRVAQARSALKVQRRAFPDRAWVAESLLSALPPARVVYAAASDFVPDGSHRPPGGPRPVHVLKRGDIHKPGAAAVPGALACVDGLPGEFQLSHPGDEAARRAALARWLSDARNPLTYRSIVNRVWQHLVGRGLVETPNDFGRMGAPPSHPELLDWLTSRFLADGGSLKQLQRLIVTSAAYRQAVIDDARSASIDAENRLLWRMNRRRLDAESVHDAILRASGRLDTTMGGPSVRQFSLRPGVHVTPVIDYSQYDHDSPGAGRRSVYRFVFRTLPDPFLESLDEADASQLTATRSESITPLQAFALLNNPFVLRQAEHLARRLERERSTLPDRIDRLFELVVNRPAGSTERSELEAYARRHGLVNACRMLLNSNEFLFLD
ncbi:MAG: PSD1 and planctomycete cytochrome C domain-containing protein [Isosphaeraceae bacterium]